MIDRIDDQIVSAHRSGEFGQLANLYRQVGLCLIDEGKENEGCFFITQAYIVALEGGLDMAVELREMLVQLGRER